ncbi:MAG: topoisomerase C-terminal repeat-containing protein [Clostridia bacterium]|nr:topoisomerase C-terminal repeat-containing protein [Clostridia bacterium]
MKLIIAEKPSLARNIAGAIGNMKKAPRYFEGEGYIVTWAFGHLFSLADIEHYSPLPDGENRWSMKNLPCFPKKFEFELKKNQDKKVDSGVLEQFNTIRDLCNRADVTEIINAGDADREGEIIVRTCVMKSETDKPFKRLWLPDQTNETILQGLLEMKDETHYDNLAKEGYARTFIDWLYGVNLTRYATLKTGTLMRVGRVIVPIVKAIYDRDMQIRNFVPDTYYAPYSLTEQSGGEIELTSKQKFEKKELSKAQELCNLYNEKKGVVTDKKTKKDTLSAGKLFSLTKLQNVLGKKYKMPMDESLRIVQGLYEKGYVTYPRTNSEYMATAEKGKVKQILSAVEKLGYPVKFKDGKTIFDDSKIESHSALTPTHKIPSKTALSEEEAKVYGTIMRRFVAVFCSEECIAQKSEIKIDVAGKEEFTLKGTIILQAGWTKYDEYTKKDKILPNLEKGDIIDVNFTPKEKETSPLKHYTIETLNNYLKNPFREDKANAKTEDDEEEYRAIFEGLELGTEATRTGIIENAIKSNYISLKKDVYTILPDGENLIESLSRMGISMDKYKTSYLGQALKKVYKGEITVKDSILLTEREIEKVFVREEQSIQRDTDDGFIGDIAGRCPLCGKNVVRTKFGYGCEGYKDGCKFSVNNVILGRVISLSNIKMLLESGKTSKIEGFISKKTGKPFSAVLKLDGDKVTFDF